MINYKKFQIRRAGVVNYVLRAWLHFLYYPFEIELLLGISFQDNLTYYQNKIQQIINNNTGYKSLRTISEYGV